MDWEPPFPCVQAPLTLTMPSRQVSEARVLMSHMSLKKAGLTSGSKVEARYFQKQELKGKKKKKIKGIKLESTGSVLIPFPKAAPRRNSVPKKVIGAQSMKHTSHITPSTVPHRQRCPTSPAPRTAPW